MSLTLGIIFGLLSMIGLGLSGAISKVPNKEVGEKRTIFFRNIFVVLLLIILLLIFLKSTTFKTQFILIGLGISIISYPAIISFYKGIKVGKVGIVSPIAHSATIFTVIFSMIFFV